MEGESTKRLRPRTLLLQVIGESCKICGSKSQLELDHIAPLSKGGIDHFSNLQTLCRSCHYEKHSCQSREYRYQKKYHREEFEKDENKREKAAEYAFHRAIIDTVEDNLVHAIIEYSPKTYHPAPLYWAPDFTDRALKLIVWKVT